MKLSVIVPIYNVERYLPACIDSILAQTHKELEIILVDDGSTDACPTICDRYATMDPRIIVIHKKNVGLSDARNAGLDIASGEWISFIDSDDWIEPDMYEKLLKNAHIYDSQISVGAVSVDKQTDQGVIRLNPSDTSVISCKKISSIEAMRKHLADAWSAWDKIYRKEIFETIRYPLGELNEDEAIMLQVLERARSIVYTNEVFYHYIQRSTSITGSPFSAKKLAWMKHCADNFQFIRSNYPELTLDAARRYRSSLMWSLSEIALSSDNFSEEIRHARKELRTYKKMFRKIPFRYPQDRIRMEVLLHLPFPLYKSILRLKRKI